MYIGAHALNFIILWLQAKNELSKAKLELLQLQNAIGEDITEQFSESACIEVQKVARGTYNMHGIHAYVLHVHVLLQLNNYVLLLYRGIKKW